MDLAAFRAMETDLLDPRFVVEAGNTPVALSVNIPVGELPRRAHELTPRHRPIRVLDFGASSLEAVDWLRSSGRLAGVVPVAAGSVPASDHVRAATEPAAKHQAIWRLWQPSSFLLDAADRVKGGRAMDLACGTGRNAVALAMLGWEVAAVDILPDALDRAASLYERYRDETAGPLETILGDLLDPRFRPDARFDLVAVFAFHHPPLLPRLQDWLNPGGMVVCECFTHEHHRRYGKPRLARTVPDAEELAAMMHGLSPERAEVVEDAERTVACVVSRKDG